MESFKKYFIEYITGMFPAAGPFLPDQTMRPAPIKLGRTEPIEQSIKPVQSADMTRLIVNLLNKLIESSLQDLQVQETNDMIALRKNDLNFIEFDKPFDYINGKVVISYRVNHINDEVLDLLDDLKIIEQEKENIIFNRQSF